MRACKLILLMGAMLLASSCESWLSPAEGNGIRGDSSANQIVVKGIGGSPPGFLGDHGNGFQVRLDSSAPVTFYTSHTFRGVSGGPHTLAARGGSGAWGFCSFTLPPGGSAYVTVSGSYVTCNVQ